MREARQITLSSTIQIIPEAEKNLSDFSEFSHLPYAKYDNSEISQKN